ncbi:MAG: ABC transporter substrate-binding protein, partial [Proteobacteria bacterium]|nr:ABC transporter substrate-binding protein [Pseudomonadota bacterium]
MRRIDRSFLLVILLALFASFRGADARAEERILALAPHVAEILYAVGAGDSIVGAVRYCDYPPAAAALPVVGGYKAISVEAALRTRPTLAIALDASVEGGERLAALGVRVAYAHPQTVREALQDIERIGR